MAAEASGPSCIMDCVRVPAPSIRLFGTFSSLFVLLSKPLLDSAYFVLVCGVLPVVLR